MSFVGVLARSFSEVDTSNSSPVINNSFAKLLPSNGKMLSKLIGRCSSNSRQKNLAEQEERLACGSL